MVLWMMRWLNTTKKKMFNLTAKLYGANEAQRSLRPNERLVRRYTITTVHRFKIVRVI